MQRHHVYITDSLNKIQKLINKYKIAHNLVYEYDVYMSNTCLSISQQCRNIIEIQTKLDQINNDYMPYAHIEGITCAVYVCEIVNSIVQFIIYLKRNMQLTDTEDIIALNSIEYNKVSDVPIAPLEYVCCNKSMEGDEFMFEYVCLQCGLIKVSNSIVRDDRPATITSEEYTHSRTLSVWVNNILGLNKFSLCDSERDILVNAIVPKYGPVGRAHKLSLEQLRAIFKRYKLTKLNKYAASILSYFTGECPPTLTSIELEDMDQFYYRVINYIKTEPKIMRMIPEKNRTYCPYYIYKYAQIKWHDDPSHLIILKFIHIQEPDTVMQMETIWKLVCNHFNYPYYKIKFTDTTSFEHR